MAGQVINELINVSATRYKWATATAAATVVIPAVFFVCKGLRVKSTAEEECR